MKRMKKVDWRFALRLFIVQLILSLITFLLLPTLLGVLPGNPAVQWMILVLCCGICYTFLFLDCTVKGSKDVAMDEIARKQNERAGREPEDFAHTFYPRKGLVAAAIAQTPFFLAALVLLGMQLAGSPAALWLEMLLRTAYMMIAYIFTLFENGVPAYLFMALSCVFCLVAWWGYTNGVAQRRRMNLIIQRNDARLARKQSIKKGRNKRK